MNRLSAEDPPAGGTAHKLTYKIVKHTSSSFRSEIRQPADCPESVSIYKTIPDAPDFSGLRE